MFTRRARIKGVTALPPRRKNAETDVKKKQESEVIKTPKPRRVSFDKSVNISNVSPRGPRPSPRKSPRQNTRTPERYTAPERRVFTPIHIDKDRSTPNIEKAAENVFISPLVRASPRRRSSIVRTPVIEVDVRTERLITSHGVQDVCERVEINNDVNRSTATPVPVDKESGNTTDEESQSIQNEVMDGIIPLQPVKVPPKPLDLLKNEIISENAEVSFDPIIPLPSPSKVRPKLRPVPRLGPLRRNSIQGSASESEDESRRALHGSATPVPMRQRERYDSNITLPATNRDLKRVRNDSVCSSMGHSTLHAPTTSSPLREKEKNATTSRRLEVSRRMAAMRKRKESVQRERLTMYDLIFYNPITNPIIPDQEEIRAREANKKEEEERKALEKAKEEKKEDEPITEAAPVPQIKLGPNGEIVLDEQSLVIKPSQRDISLGVVCEGAWGDNRSIYRRTPRTADWSDAETVRFYRAVAAIGTDFSLMQPLFPTRTRRDLKLKFKKEERMNAAQLDKALRAGARWDVTSLEIEFNNERKLAEENAKKEKDKLKTQVTHTKGRHDAMLRRRVKKSRGSKILESSIMPQVNTKNNIPSTAEDIITTAREDKETIKNKQTKKSKGSSHSAVQTRKSPPKEREKEKPPEAQRSDTPLLPVPKNIENGSLVVLAVDDPNMPSKKMFQTYISHEGGALTPVCLSSNFLNSVVGYMKKGGSSPQLSSPSTSERATPIDLTPRRKKQQSSSSVTH